MFHLAPEAVLVVVLTVVRRAVHAEFFNVRRTAAREIYFVSRFLFAIFADGNDIVRVERIYLQHSVVTPPTTIQTIKTEGPTVTNRLQRS